MTANIAVRLMQVHLCILYLFAGISKLQGPAWWNGTAFWGAIGNLEYQTFNLLWLADAPWVVNLLTHATVAWEIAYCAIVWNRTWRPLVLAFAIPLHLGIGICFGMMTFGTIMLVANMAFIPPEVLRSVLDPLATRLRGAPQRATASPVQPPHFRRRSGIHSPVPGNAEIEAR